MYPVVIGSQALKYHKRLDREPSDWDLIVSGPKQFIKKQGFTLDLISSQNPLEPTNEVIFLYCQTHGHGPINTPYGLALVAPLEIIKLLKLASLPLDKFKHQLDLKKLEDIVLPPSLEEVLQKRIKETEFKVLSQKDKFFNKYKVPRLIEHDELHLFISSSPMYLSILKDDSSTEVSEEKFNKLPLNLKKELVLEEVFILSLERALIPQVRKAPQMVELLVEQFSKVSKTSDPSLYWLNRLAIVGKVKDHPDWLATWIANNYNFLTVNLDSWWNTKLEALPKTFWHKLLHF